jgi:hypothetical protein
MAETDTIITHTQCPLRHAFYYVYNQCISCKELCTVPLFPYMCTANCWVRTDAPSLRAEDAITGLVCQGISNLRRW